MSGLTFGSVGDIIAVCEIVRQLVQALSESRVSDFSESLSPNPCSVLGYKTCYGSIGPSDLSFHDLPSAGIARLPGNNSSESTDFCMYISADYLFFGSLPNPARG